MTGRAPPYICDNLQQTAGQADARGTKVGAGVPGRGARALPLSFPEPISFRSPLFGTKIRVFT